MDLLFCDSKPFNKHKASDASFDRNFTAAYRLFMRILHVLSQTILTGAEVYATEISDWLIEQGHDVWIISDTFHLKTKANILLSPVHESRGRRSTIKKIKNLVRDQQIDVIHTHSRASAKVSFYACLGMKQSARPLRVHTFHGLQKGSLSKSIFNVYGDEGIFVCEELSRILIQRKMALPSQSHFIRNPVQIKSSIAQNTQAAQTAPRQNLKFGHSPRLKVALIARLSNLKGQRVLFLLKNVFRVLLKEINFELHLIGGDQNELTQRDQNELSELSKHFPETFHNLGHQTQLQNAILNYDVVIAGGRIAVESLLLGKSVIAFGESTFLGEVTLSNLKRCFATNFGDIDLQEHDPLNSGTWDSPSLLAMLADTLKMKIASLKSSVGIAPGILQSVQQEYDYHQVCEKIYRCYQGGIGRKLYPSGLTILMYHKVVKTPLDTPHRIFITEENFEKHLQFYKQQGFTTLHFQELADFKNRRRSREDFPKKPLVLTFDDGYVNNLELALPLLEKYQMKATVFLLAENSLPSNIWDKDSGDPQLPLMNPSQRQIFANHPLIEIGSHGFRHRPLDEMTTTEAQEEIYLSKKSLEKEFQRKIVSFAYTYGRRRENASQLCRDAGYEFAVNTDTGSLHPEDDPFSLFRVSIFPEDDGFSLRKKTASWYRKYYHFKRGK